MTEQQKTRIRKHLMAVHFQYMRLIPNFTLGSAPRNAIGEEIDDVAKLLEELEKMS